VIETERLVLRVPRSEDAPSLLEAFADPEAMRYIGDGSTTDLAGAEEAVGRWLERWDAWGIGMFVVERVEDARVLGRAGFLRWDPETWEIGGRETELGWGLAREHWGHGYATEAATAWLDHGFGRLAFERIISITDHDNLRSLSVMRRLGMTFDHEAQVRDGEEVFDAVIYAITRDRWLARRGDDSRDLVEG
jgi:RimJ/RimL family protein N-acetyltransferase